jgi:hypothetical protein
MIPASTTTMAWYTAEYPAAKVTHSENSTAATVIDRSRASSHPCSGRRRDTR